MDIHEKRRRNFAALLERYEFQKDLADAVGRAPSYVSQLLAPSGRSGSRNIGESVARDFERRLGLKPYSLDELEGNHDEAPRIAEPDPVYQDRKVLSRKLSSLVASGKLATEDMALLVSLAERLAQRADSRENRLQIIAV